MAVISAKFVNTYGSSRKWTIWDTGIDPNDPKIVFDDYLDVNQETPALELHDIGAGHGQVQYKRSDGNLIVGVEVSDGEIKSIS